MQTHVSLTIALEVKTILVIIMLQMAEKKRNFPKAMQVESDGVKIQILADLL